MISRYSVKLYNIKWKKFESKANYCRINIRATTGISTSAKNPILVCPLIVHLCGVQFGSHEWFMKRDSFPRTLESI